jgi:hypothetical protein
MTTILLVDYVFGHQIFVYLPQCSKLVAPNGLGLCEVGAFKAQMFNLAQMFIRITNA